MSGWLGSEMCLDSHPQHPVTPTLKEVSEEFAYISGVMRHCFRRKICSVPFCCLSWSQMLGCADIQLPHLLIASATPKGYLSLLGLDFWAALDFWAPYVLRITNATKEAEMPRNNEGLGDKVCGLQS